MYDVDVAAVCGLALLACVGYFIEARPLYARAQALEHVARDIDAERGRLRQLRREVDDLAAGTAVLRDRLAARVSALPTEADAGALAVRVIALAEAHGLRVVTYTPGKLEQRQHVSTCTLDIQARGPTPGFIHFLGDLAVRVPNHAVESYAINADPNLGGGANFSLSLRLFLVPRAAP